jgi:hypothetical protein
MMHDEAAPRVASNGGSSHGTNSSPAWHAEFLELLPSIRRHARLRFGSLRRELREELVQETIARTVCDYVRLCERGRKHVALAGPLARFAVAQVASGRKLGTPMNSRDISSRYCQWRRGVRGQSLSQYSKGSCDSLGMLAENRRTTPADIAAARIDIRAWFATLPRRTRALAERLAMGESTLAAAREFGVTPGRVSQLRRELERRWVAFQGTTSVVD